MLLVGILAFVVVPRFTTLQGYDEIGYRDRVKATLEYARKAAVAQRRNVQVALAAGTVTVTIATDTPEGPGATTYGRSLTLPGSNSNQIVAPSGVTLSPSATLVFDPLGRASAAGNFTISGAGSITVEAETGYVH